MGVHVVCLLVAFDRLNNIVLSEIL